MILSAFEEVAESISGADIETIKAKYQLNFTSQESEKSGTKTIIKCSKYYPKIRKFWTVLPKDVWTDTTTCNSSDLDE